MFLQVQYKRHAQIAHNGTKSCTRQNKMTRSILEIIVVYLLAIFIKYSAFYDILFIAQDKEAENTSLFPT